MRNPKAGLPALLDELYEGMLDDEAWSRALTRTCDHFGVASLALFSVDPATNAVHRADLLRNDPAAMRAYQETWIHEDPRHAAGLECQVGEPQTEGMLVDVRAMRRMPIYHEFMLRWDMPYFMATWIVRQPRRGVVLTLLHDSQRGEFGEDERDAMRMLVPHVRRILEVKDRLEHARVTSETLRECADRLPFGTLFLGADLRILEASATARELLARRDGIHADDGALGFVRSSDARAFTAMLTKSGLLARDLDCMHVQRPPPLAPLALVAAPVVASHGLLKGAARWIVMLFDPERGGAPDELQLRRALGISAAEAALARLLTAGMTVSEAAVRLHVTRNTARSQLKSIYLKTGVNTQAQLIRRILMSPALLGRFHPNG